MNKPFNDDFKDSLFTGFLDKNIESELTYRPQLLTNKIIPKEKVLSTLLQEFNTCNEFFISVAFVTTSGIAVILNTLLELEKRGVKGKVLVSQYLNFTQPEALKKLRLFKNIELKISTKDNAHSKGYIFKKKEHYNLIVGSSNLTSSALTVNKEWNLKVSGLNASDIVEKVLNEFQDDFDRAIPVTDEFIASYQVVYDNESLYRKQTKKELPGSEEVEVTPNSMQAEALKNLTELRLEKKNKALIISATGTGKTYLSAFDVKNFNPKKLLFVVHRLNIAEDALKTFKDIFRDTKSYGIYSGNKKDLEADFIFSTVQTISREDHLSNFNKDEFDYIIIDESHRSGADSYLRLIKYFTPKFLLGMTATPERTDGNDIFSLFDHNIAYEIRLNRAMEEDMLSEFHYFGITDLTINNEVVEDTKDFRLLTSDERVDRIIENAKIYGSDNGITRGLVFCSRNEESKNLSLKFNARGFKTISLSGESSEAERKNAISRLESTNNNERLDYIFTVDIFNEGIDIPKINQILMIRPTDSAIVFVQQLGRGLRKVNGKDYLTVIDFIGNHKNNYLIPIALYGDTSYNKDSLRKMISEGSKMLPGPSTINFDEITKEKIFESIDSANMRLLSDLKKDYQLLKYRLGRTPMMMDFLENESRDPFLFVEYSKSYYNFVRKADKDFDTELPPIPLKLLELFSSEINNYKRVEECLILKHLIEEGSLTIEDFKRDIQKKYQYSVSDKTINSAVANLNFKFIREKKDSKLLSVKEIYNLDILTIKDEEFIVSEIFQSYLENKNFKSFLLDSTYYSLYKFDELFEIENWQDGFVLYRKYSRKDVFRILNVSVNPVAQNVGGYLVSPDNSHCPIFVNYHKEDHISESTKYVDEFVNNKELDWMTKSNRKVKSNDVQSILGKKGDIRLPLFIKKDNDEGMDFYYMGEVKPNLNLVESTTIKNDNGKTMPIVKIRLNLVTPVISSLYNYITAVNDKEIPEQNIEKEVIPLETEESQAKFTIPLFDFYAAAGNFSELQAEKDYSELEVEEKYSLNNNYFACKVTGESMNKRIPNGSICIFKKYTGGSRNGKIVLVESRDIHDPDFNSGFTVKTYSSQKSITEDGWGHKEIVLKPNSYDENFKDIVLDEENAEGMKVIGEFVSVLE